MLPPGDFGVSPVISLNVKMMPGWIVWRFQDYIPTPAKRTPKEIENQYSLAGILIVRPEIPRFIKRMKAALRWMYAVIRAGKGQLVIYEFIVVLMLIGEAGREKLHRVLINLTEADR
jgi:hypothetical protein